jgi:hypothetical protein
MASPPGHLHVVAGLDIKEDAPPIDASYEGDHPQLEAGRRRPEVLQLHHSPKGHQAFRKEQQQRVVGGQFDNAKQCRDRENSNTGVAECLRQILQGHSALKYSNGARNGSK